MNQYKGNIYHHGRPKKFTKRLVIQAVETYKKRKQLGMTAKEVAEKYHMSRTMLYRKIHLIQVSTVHHGKLSRRGNLYLLGRYSLELIHNGGHLFTGLRTSLIDTETVLHNGEVPDILPSEVDLILRIKKGLQYIMNHRGPLTLKVFQDINAITTPNSYEPGHFAQVPMHITGVTWQPPKPNPKRARTIIKRYKSNHDSASLTAIKIMLQFDRYQFFWNGNKRTAWLSANYYLLQHGAGILNISQHQERTWNRLLAKFYETGRIQHIASWVNHNCIMDKL